MIRITQLKMSLDDKDLKGKIIHTLKISSQQLQSFQIIRKSIDARKKPTIFLIYTVDCVLQNVQEGNLVKKLHSDQITISDQKEYIFPYHFTEASQRKDYDKKRPVIIGTGPAGLFCGYILALNGYRPILLERGEKAEERKKTVEHFWKTGELNTESNVQFGEGGAGTFSDGKLNTLVKDPDGRNRKVLNIFCDNGADEEILYDYKAHIGTDRLIEIITNMRKRMEAEGAEFSFNSKVTDFILSENKVQGVILSDGRKILSDYVIAAIGHSARDTFPVLLDKGCIMEQKDFAVGFRVIHPQRMINHSQYGMDTNDTLQAAPYKLTGINDGGMNAYSFCMCPGGYVVNASSESGKLAINGMSYAGRDGSCANSAIVVTLPKTMFQSEHPLAGIEFQRDLEKKAFQLADGMIPSETLEDFRSNCHFESNHNNDGNEYFEGFQPAIKGLYKLCAVDTLLPEKLNQIFLQNMEQFAKKINGFANDHAFVCGIESRTSSPVRIVRNEQLESNIKGIYPCGEGAGYAGGITSAAMDGLRVAEKIAQSINQSYSCV